MFSKTVISGAALSAAVLLVGAIAAAHGAAHAADAPDIVRGKYLVQVAGCTDCHTPGYFTGSIDPEKFLSGSDVGFQVPGVGTVVGRNLTPDKETGLGNWSLEQIIRALTKGTRPDGRLLSPVMPWAHYASLAPRDTKAIARYLQTLPPVRHTIPGPFAANQKPTVTTWRLASPESAGP
ncbi:MAG: cytochrome c [Gammaproteobacteria bacterium]